MKKKSLKILGNWSKITKIVVSHQKNYEKMLKFDRNSHLIYETSSKIERKPRKNIKIKWKMTENVMK